MYNLYNKNKTNDLVGQKATNFYIPIDAVVSFQDCPNKLAGIGSNNIHVIGSDFNDRISVYAIEVLTPSDDESK